MSNNTQTKPKKQIKEPNNNLQIKSVALQKRKIIKAEAQLAIMMPQDVVQDAQLLRNDTDTRILTYNGILLRKVEGTRGARLGTMKYNCNYLTITRNALTVSQSIRERLGLSEDMRFDIMRPAEGAVNADDKPFVILHVNTGGDYVFNRGYQNTRDERKYGLTSTSKWVRGSIEALGSKNARKRGAVHIKVALVERGSQDDIVFELTGLN